jgi:preprotein translocase subunit SecA
MRIFAPPKVAGLMQRMGMQEGEAIEHPWVSKAIENAQRKVEGHNFDIRKNLLEYDDVANDQRRVIYSQRNELMAADDISETIKGVRVDVVNAVIDTFVPPQSLEEQWDVPGLEDAIEGEFGLKLPLRTWLEQDESLHEETLRERIVEELERVFAEKEAQVGSPVMRHFEKAVMLQVLDTQWKEHLANMDYLRQGIHLRGYAQKNPKQEYKREAFELFGAMLERVKHETITLLSKIQFRSEQDVEAVEAQRRAPKQMEFQHAEASALSGGAGESEPGGEAEKAEPFVREGRKVGRNEPCPCGSGKKYKHCHGRLS